MKRFKRICKLGGLMLLIILASVGIGLSGGIPVPAAKRKEEMNLVHAKMLKIEEVTSEQNQVDLFKQR